MKKIVLCMGIACSLGACSVSPPEDYAGAIAASVPPSASIKAQIVRDARTFLADPYSVRDAGISNVATFNNGLQGVCVRANSKNKMGGYTGRQNLAVLIQNGMLVGNVPNHQLCSRPDVPWRKFPELEALRDL
ncbi:hypothetical protein [Roseovarius sp. D22-M7]|uniref:hypothetical protein n=1 Tax=Roseovarius sp. D22-M7 TaxID=3127116 RepID=UPI00300FC920